MHDTPPTRIFSGDPPPDFARKRSKTNRGSLETVDKVADTLAGHKRDAKTQTCASQLKRDRLYRNEGFLWTCCCC
jgi:hypothetical protein